LINQRKRVAKRLASGLMAGALALGGLAISGSSPAGAVPIERTGDKTIQGSDRFQTAALVADLIDSNDFVDEISALIVANGRTPYDALAAAALTEGGNVPIVLVEQDAIPESALGTISSFVDSVDDVYILGGEAAVSADVEDQLSNLFTMLIFQESLETTVTERPLLSQTKSVTVRRSS